MDLKDLLKTKPGDLAAAQEKALRAYVVEKLRQVATLIELCDYDAAGRFLSESPAGDDHGLDNSYIDFSELGLSTDQYKNDNTDLGRVLEVLNHLKAIQGK